MFRRILNTILQRSFIGKLFSEVASVSDKYLTITIIISNFLPVLGTLLLGWDTSNIMIYFWIDNVVLGLFHFLKMLSAQGGKNNKLTQRLSQGGCFILLWGFLSFVHGVFVFILTLSFIYGATTGVAGIANNQEFDMKSYDLQPLFVSLIVTLILQCFDFIRSYIITKEYKESDASKMLMLPFGRAMVLHFVIIIFGFFLSFISNLLSVFVYSFSLISPSFQTQFATIVRIILGLFTASLIGIIKTWWDFRVLLNADKLGEYTTKKQKLAAKNRRKVKLYRKIMKEKTNY